MCIAATLLPYFTAYSLQFQSSPCVGSSSTLHLTAPGIAPCSTAPDLSTRFLSADSLALPLPEKSKHASKCRPKHRPHVRREVPLLSSRLERRNEVFFLARAVTRASARTPLGRPPPLRAPPASEAPSLPSQEGRVACRRRHPSLRAARRGARDHIFATSHRV